MSSNKQISPENIVASEHLRPSDTFEARHIGHTEQDLAEMLSVVGYDSLDALIKATVPSDIRLEGDLDLTDLPDTLSEAGILDHLRSISRKNRVFRNMIGMGYHDTNTPAVILRNVLENARWYTPYTPYQAEISQGRLEALLNFQTMVSDLTGMELANASLLDEATAASEAMAMAVSIARGKKNRFFVADSTHPQTIALMKTRARSMDIELEIGKIWDLNLNDDAAKQLAGVLVQYPTTDGNIEDYSTISDQIHKHGGLMVVAADLLALTLLRAPGEFGADIVIGNTQRFGVPMGFGGPHAAYMATHEKYVRKMPGRIVGVSVDSQGNKAYRLTIQTREQHIKRDRATSNICTAQVLLATIAGFYAVFHGPEGIKKIAWRVHSLTSILSSALKSMGYAIPYENIFDNLRIDLPADQVNQILFAAREHLINLRKLNSTAICVNLDETTTLDEVQTLIGIFAEAKNTTAPVAKSIADSLEISYKSPSARTSDFLSHEVFNRYHSEHELLRYMTRLLDKDISLANSMIPLGSCTMKLNAAAELIPITWPEFSKLHPYAPSDQTRGYRELFSTLQSWLAEITGFEAVSLQPNSGANGEYAGLMAIKRCHIANNHAHRDICLIPLSAHGTNPASSVIAGLKVIGIKCDNDGNIDLDDLKAQAEKHSKNLAALMITYPSTHGVYEAPIKQICQIIHDHGGLVYMDGANMNAQVGLTSPGIIGADVCHLNLHKTFAIPHGGGGPGMGPICSTKQLAPYLPGNPITGDAQSNYASTAIWGLDPDPSEDFNYPVSAAPYGSASILPISWMYIALLSSKGLKRATKIAILNANYITSRLKNHYNILYTGDNGTVAHEGIVDCRDFQKTADISVEDIAKRLIDFGFHAPTMSWPVAGTLMIEPTESESKQELDRFCDAMIAIRKEISDIEANISDQEDNPLRNAPHTASMIANDDWPHNYTRQQAAYPAAWQNPRNVGASNAWKYWPPVSRVDNAYGDRNLQCSCPTMEAYQDA
ncbi:Glycine dehydrogenase (decarboxylating) [Poriferisphaera corsica]|uniref:Glycine dehydrogenase (decarboxylating) n=1 Tax=Poriferisphaera corsica TaxID=2528020 RepID=A0A517YYV6_9BACT|nr:aminomethyl-transferring glycine dehydrogenase [Poriferisphaera corsica]QDU35414.1 Glycine dehydrogenase (decarboxylating) [Poriferisphaera corsica]